MQTAPGHSQKCPYKNCVFYWQLLHCTVDEVKIPVQTVNMYLNHPSKNADSTFRSSAGRGH